MATATTNYGLTKPSYGDNSDIAVINSNMDKIDAKMKEIEDAGGIGASTWAEVANKPFETVGSGLNVDEIGALNVTGGGSGGSSVSWNQLQTSGSKIAEVTIDGTKTDVYAPTGGGEEALHTYSEEEHIVGTWIDGRPVYEAIYTFSAANDFQWHWFMDLGFGDIELISFEPLANISGVTTDSNQYARMYNVGPWTFGVKVGTGFSPIVDGKVIIRYIKR